MAALLLAPLDMIEGEVQQALDICGGDPMKALRITLIANAFLEARIEELTSNVPTGFARQRVRKAAERKTQ